MKGLIEEGAWVTCTFDTAGVPQQLEKSSPEGARYEDGNRFLTVEDKTTKKCFKCKSPAKFWGGLAALVSGIVIGALVIASGPIGWGLAAAAVSIGMVGGFIVGEAVQGIVASVHDCSDPQKGGKWLNYHDTLYIKGSYAILYNKSLMQCEISGGILMASETQAEAQNLAYRMGSNTRREVGIHILSQAFYGALAGATSGANLAVNIFNIVAGGGIYAIGESNSDLGLALSGTKTIGPDKTIALYQASVDVAKNGGSFWNSFFKGPGGYAASSLVATLGASLLDYFVVNPFEDSLQDENMNLQKQKTNNSSTGKSVVANI